jgi:hypothetical protein
MTEQSHEDQVRAFLETVTYPINTRTLLETARRDGASPEVVRLLEQLPDEVYNDHGALHSDLNRLGESAG